MAGFSFKKTIVRGIALALPLGIAAYVLIRFVGIFEKIILPVATKFGVAGIFGQITVTLFALIAMLLLAFLLGLLMRLPLVAGLSHQLQDLILKMVPSLNHLKLIAAEKLDIENATVNWKPVLLKKGEEYLPAFLIEEAGEWVTFAKVKAPSTEPGDLMITKRNLISYTQITMREMKQYNKQFGKGYISLMQKNSDL